MDNDFETIELGVWDDARHAALEAECLEEVKAAGREAEAVGTLGQSRPSTKEMFLDVFKEPDWRIREQRGQVGV